MHVFKRIWYDLKCVVCLVFESGVAAQIAHSFVGRDVGSRRRTRQGAHGGKGLDRQSAKGMEREEIIVGYLNKLADLSLFK